MIIEDLRRVLEDKADAFFAAFGGQELYIPKCPTADHSISLEIGVEAATRLGAYFGGTTIYVPWSETRASRNREIAADLAAGTCSLQELSRRYGLSRRHLRRLKGSS